MPGSHTWDSDGVPTPDEIVPAEMSPDSVLQCTGTVMHGGGANSSESDRLGALIHYTLNWLRQEENQYLSCPPHIAKDFGPELRKLIGYSKGGYVLGFYSDPSAPGGAGFEQASPERLFSARPDAADVLLSAQELVNRTT